MIILKIELKNRAEIRAIEERARLKIGAYEPLDIFKILRNEENISIVITKLVGEISGFYLKKIDGLIVINANRSLGHQNFTAAHEYYHFKYDTGLNGKICAIKSYEDDYDNELEANYFASYFLMPDDALRYNLNKRLSRRNIALADLIYFENYFMISHALMLRRLKEMNIITEQQRNEMKIGIISNAKKLGYSTKLYEKTETDIPIIFSEYAEIANDLLNEGKITNGKYEELLIDGGYLDLIVNGAEEEISDEETINF